jgi:GNAT superfamily N-acetyltransferase
MRCREAVASDVPALAELAGELGYPSSAEQVGERFRRLLDHPELHGVFVAEGADGVAAAWVHVFVSLRLESEPFAEIGGLVVGAASRGGGVGVAMVRCAEAWARGRGLARLRVRSNVIRERAHRFYERVGFARLKEQVVLVKELRAP